MIVISGISRRMVVAVVTAGRMMVAVFSPLKEHSYDKVLFWSLHLGKGKFLQWKTNVGVHT